MIANWFRQHKDVFVHTSPQYTSRCFTQITSPGLPHFSYQEYSTWYSLHVIMPEHNQFYLGVAVLVGCAGDKSLRLVCLTGRS